jgi:hypothetical protein
MKKQLIALALAVGLGSMSTPAFAGQGDIDTNRPVKLTDQEMDNVTAGELVLVALSFSNVLAQKISVNVAAQTAVQAAIHSKARQSIRFGSIHQR